MNWSFHSRLRDSLLRRFSPPPARATPIRFERPLVVLQSDDWGRVGVRDRAGWDELSSAGIDLGRRPYDFYSLETAADVDQLRIMLQGHRDSTGRPPVIVMNFITANVDFDLSAGRNPFIPLRPLSLGLPGRWTREGLFDAFRAGISQGVFYPALHGLAHFCLPAVSAMLASDSSQGDLLRSFWTAETPYIYWRMPWVGYEFCRPGGEFLTEADQADLIWKSVRNFTELFGCAPISACAPGYRANRDTHKAWAEAGIRVAQNGPGSPALACRDEHGILYVSRSVDFEPCHGEIDIDHCLNAAADCFRAGSPFIISVHSINFHSTLKDFRSHTIAALDRLLGALESRFPGLLYCHDGDLDRFAVTGNCDLNFMPDSAIPASAESRAGGA